MNAEPTRTARLRWGIVGTGGFATSIFAPTLLAAGQDLVGAAGSSPEGSRRFAEEHGCARSYASVEQLLSDPTLDAVWVASPNHRHEAHVTAALAQGKHVLAEKPLATTAAAADRVAAHAARAGRCLAVGYQGRFHPANRELIDLVRSGRLGALALIHVRWLTQYPALPRQWRQQRDTSGGWALMDIGTHLFDIARRLVPEGDVRVLGARLSANHFAVETDDLAVMLLQIGSTTVVLEAATGLPSPERRIEVSGTDGWANVTDAFVDRLGPAGGQLATSFGDLHRFDDAPNPYDREVRAFAEWTNGGEWPGGTAADGAENVRVLETVRTIAAR